MIKICKLKQKKILSNCPKSCTPLIKKKIKKKKILRNKQTSCSPTSTTKKKKNHPIMSFHGFNGNKERKMNDITLEKSYVQQQQERK